jgi:hypothetical protein
MAGDYHTGHASLLVSPSMPFAIAQPSEASWVCFGVERYILRKESEKWKVIYKQELGTS